MPQAGQEGDQQQRPRDFRQPREIRPYRPDAVPRRADPPVRWPVVQDEEWRILSPFYKSPFFFDSKVLKDEEQEVFLPEPDPTLAKIPHLSSGETVAKTINLFKQGKDILEIADERGLSPATVINHIVKAFQQSDELRVKWAEMLRA